MGMKCRVSFCNKPYSARGLCKTHHEWWRRHKDEPLENIKQRRPREIHGRTHTSEYKTWSSMIDRCINPNNIHYSYYGGRGITVCDRWRSSFKAFFSDMGEHPVGMTLDRINNSGNYEPENCKWSTRQEQMRNTRINSRNKSGAKGVSWYNREQRWFAEMHINGKKVSKRFKTLEEAIEARRQMERDLI